MSQFTRTTAKGNPIIITFPICGDYVQVRGDVTLPGGKKLIVTGSVYPLGEKAQGGYTHQVLDRDINAAFPITAEEFAAFEAAVAAYEVEFHPHRIADRRDEKRRSLARAIWAREEEIARKQDRAWGRGDEAGAFEVSDQDTADLEAARAALRAFDAAALTDDEKIAALNAFEGTETEIAAYMAELGIDENFWSGDDAPFQSSPRQQAAVAYARSPEGIAERAAFHAAREAAADAAFDPKHNEFAY